MFQIYHNPKCSTSRRALDAIRETGVEPEIILYLQDPPDRQTILKLVADAGIPLISALRRRNTPFDELGLGKEGVTEDQLLDALIAHPAMLERPFVVTPKGTRLTRPLENIYEIL